MHLRSSILLIGALLALPLKSAAEKSPPNVLVILVDDLGWTDLGCYGSSYYRTPNIDAFAQTGLRFTDAYSANPVCSPTRAALLTGRNPVRVGITDWIRGDHPIDRVLLGPEDLLALPESEETLADIFKTHGYATWFIGKWHLGGEGSLPTDHGFDINIGGNHRGQPASYYAPYKNPNLGDGPDGEYLTDRLTDEAIKLLATAGEQPFLLYLSYYTVHTPITPAPRHYEEALKRAKALPELKQQWRPEGDGRTRLRQDLPDYASMVEAMDDNIGRLLNALAELGLEENTVVIFTSDNGGLTTATGSWMPTSVLPLRAGKGWCYEGGIRVPLIMRIPGLTRPGSVTHEPATSEDLLPTLLHAAALPAETEQVIDGVDLTPLAAEGATLERDTLYWHYPHYHGSQWTPGAAIRSGDWKLVYFYETDHAELYNLAEDIGEQHDLSARYPERAGKLLKQLHQWQDQLDAKPPRANPSFKKQPASE